MASKSIKLFSTSSRNKCLSRYGLAKSQKCNIFSTKENITMWAVFVPEGSFSMGKESRCSSVEKWERKKKIPGSLPSKGIFFKTYYYIVSLTREVFFPSLQILR